MARSSLFVSQLNPESARNAAPASPFEVDLALISPSHDARETAGYVVGLPRVLNIEQPLVAASAFMLHDPEPASSAHCLERTSVLP